MPAHSCPKCQSSMVEGFTIDTTYGGTHGWFEGKPKKSIWFGVKLMGKPTEIATWRCKSCGFLEHYAKG